MATNTPQIQEAEGNPDKTKLKHFILKHIIVKFLRVEDKEEIFKATC